ncbi:MarR family winged helix-turn-helix transcriptional regulator [Amycolatopsis anabasis]|uniref:MarR family winged helix-turn-helix transcriptional regulator n=1 Tax=Amycolatopsis anabasis TaxID=1840409 RepID=UPI00131C84BA|nr:MarR family transcriptional regulator [Amycolatopsis anabasis]
MDAPDQPPIAYLLAYASTLTGRHVDEVLRRHGLTVRQFGLLEQLRLEPELTASELARQLGVSRQSLHEMVGGLERAGHLHRLPGASGRTRRLALAPGTERLLARIRMTLTRAESAFLGGLNPREIQALRGLLQRLLAHATDDEAWLPGM